VKLLLKGCTDPNKVFHLPTDVGKAFIATGLCEEYIEPVKPDQPTEWKIFNGIDGENPPVLHARCPVCKATMTTENATGKVPFRHHLGAEFCPADFLETYFAAFDRWQQVHRPRQARRAAEAANAIRTHAVTWR
jgi:hypothetical protein